MPKPTSRRLDLYVEVQSLTVTLDQYGSPSRAADDWTSLGNDWIGIAEPAAGGQQKVGDQLTVGDPYTVEMHYRPDLTTACRLKFLSGPNVGKYLAITAIGPTSRPRVITLSGRVGALS